MGLMGTSSVGCQMGVVHGGDLRCSLAFGELQCNLVLTKRNWSSRTHVLIAHVVNDPLEIIDRDLCLIKDHMVVDRASCALNGRVRAEIEVILKSSGVSVHINRI